MQNSAQKQRGRPLSPIASVRPKQVGETQVAHHYRDQWVRRASPRSSPQVAKPSRSGDRRMPNPSSRQGGPSGKESGKSQPSPAFPHEQYVPQRSLQPRPGDAETGNAIRVPSGHDYYAQTPFCYEEIRASLKPQGRDRAFLRGRRIAQYYRRQRPLEFSPTSSRPRRRKLLPGAKSLLRFFKKEDDSALRKFQKYVAIGAVHVTTDSTRALRNSAEVGPAIQGEVMSWINREGGDISSMIMWLCGLAAQNATTTARSVADACLEKGWLAATFFFSSSPGDEGSCSKHSIIPTLAHQLIQHKIPGLKELILDAIEDNPCVFKKQLRHQLEVLILQPLRKLPINVDHASWPKVIVVDAPEKCSAAVKYTPGDTPSSPQSQELNLQEIISTLVRAAKDPAFPFRILIASRPEPAIDDVISKSSVPVKRLLISNGGNGANSVAPGTELPGKSGKRGL